MAFSRSIFTQDGILTTYWSSQVGRGVPVVRTALGSFHGSRGVDHVIHLSTFPAMSGSPFQGQKRGPIVSQRETKQKNKNNNELSGPKGAKRKLSFRVRKEATHLHLRAGPWAAFLRSLRGFGASRPTRRACGWTWMAFRMAALPGARLRNCLACPPARCPFSLCFFGWEGSPTKIDKKKGYPYSDLSNWGPSLGFMVFLLICSPCERCREG